ncbi:MAG: aminoglycoside phosphotransferase family protein [Nanoarchaeota archaeon]|nr:aminoglycoside phosphotransferase family protein [Nanoarchaeota archaeon]
MKQKIKNYFENLNPKRLGLENKIRITSISQLGMGTSNLNYLVKANGKSFVFRLNMKIKLRNKSKQEFEALKIVEKHKIGPKAWILDDTRREFDNDFIIIDYIEGKIIDETREYLKTEMFSHLGELCGKLHSIKIVGNLKKLKKEATIQGYKGYSRLIIKEEYLDYINSNVKSKQLLGIINETYKKLNENLPNNKYKPEIVLTQGDFCEQNVIVHNKEYKLIDFEDLRLTDRAGHLAHIFIDFGRPFENYQMELFFEEYLKKVRINKEILMEKINIWVPIKLFAIFLWSINHILRIKNREMHSKFVEQSNMERNFSYVRIMLKRNIRFGLIDSKYSNFDIVKALK